MTTGNHELYGRFEEELARFFGVESSVLVSAGYLTNLAVAEAWAGEFSHVLIDERSHSSLFLAARAFQGSIIVFRHRDVADVAQAARGFRAHGRLILLTDGMFAQDGSVAPLVAYQRVLPASGWLLVDDAHGAGVLGRNGRGTLEYVGGHTQRVIQTVTLSKAFGVYGGAILGSATVRQKVLHSPAFVGNTPLPLPLVSAAREAVRLFAADTTFRERLTRHVQRMKSALATMGFELPNTSSPIIPLLPRNAREREKLNARLLAARIYPSFIQYPGGPQNGYFRFALSSEHTEAQVDTLLRVLMDHTGFSHARPRAKA